MRKRAFLVLCVLAGGVMFALLLLVLSTSFSPGITPRNIAAITPGMTRAEVETLMGKPPGLYDTSVSVEPVPATCPPGKHWISRRAAVYVCFDGSDKVVEKHPLAVKPISRRSWWPWW